MAPPIVSSKMIYENIILPKRTIPKINIFFDYNTLNLIGWQTTDIYQNLSITFLASIKKNQKLDNSLFNLPKQN